MKLNCFLKVVALLFTVKAILGVLYLFLGWKTSIGGWVFPNWIVVSAIVADTLLASAAINFAKK